MKEDLLPETLVVQIRELPPQRAVSLVFSGRPEDLGDAVSRLTRYAVEQGVGPCGPTLASYPRFVAEAAEGEEKAGEIEAELLVPVRGRPEGDEHPLVELERLRAACISYSGRMDSNFRRAHESLFSWMDAHGVPRTGTAHYHVYLADDGGGDSWSVEIRVPIVGGSAPRPPL